MEKATVSIWAPFTTSQLSQALFNEKWYPLVNKSPDATELSLTNRSARRGSKSATLNCRMKFSLTLGGVSILIYRNLEKFLLSCLTEMVVLQLGIARRCFQIDSKTVPCDRKYLPLILVIELQVHL